MGALLQKGSRPLLKILIFLPIKNRAEQGAPEQTDAGVRAYVKVVCEEQRSYVRFLTADYASMVDTRSVVSSRTSKSTRTVSSAVKMVTLFSVAVIRISAPSVA